MIIALRILLAGTGRGAATEELGWVLLSLGRRRALGRETEVVFIVHVSRHGDY